MNSPFREETKSLCSRSVGRFSSGDSDFNESILVMHLLDVNKYIVVHIFIEFIVKEREKGERKRREKSEAENRREQTHI